LQNAFFCWYGPENLYQLVHALDIQSGIDIWEPSEHRASTAMTDILQMDTKVVEFYEWIDERTETDVTTCENDNVTESTKELEADILVVDHDVSYLKLMSRLLTDEGYEVDITLDATDALNKGERGITCL